MKRPYACVLALVIAGLVPLSSFAQNGPVKVVGLVELSGGGVTSGTNFNDGVKLAVNEINAAGGILGRKIDYTSNDTQSQPQIAKALAIKAIDDSAYVVMGPVFSGSILVSMAETKRAEVPNFTGGEAAAITQQGNPYIFRTSFTQTTAMPKVARYLKDTVKAKTVAVIWVNNDFGKGGRDVFMKAIDAQGIKAVAAKFRNEFGYKPDHNGLKGYTAMYVVKAATEKVGRFDQKAFATAMHGITLSASSTRAC